MIAPRQEELGEPGTFVSFWPGLIDLVTSALLVFLLLSFIQTVLNVDELEAMVARAQQTHFLDHFEHEFQKELAEGAISVARHLNFLQITFSDRVLFDSAEYRLKPLGRDMLRRCAHIFEAAGSSGYQQVQVEGHTDSLPVRSDEYPADNWELSTARAISVIRYLTSASALPADVFSANGYADRRPVAANDTAGGRARNRRMEIRLFFSLPHDQHRLGELDAQ